MQGDHRREIMMNEKEIDKKIAQYCVEALKKKGMDKYHIILDRSKKEELNVETGRFSLMRTAFDTQLHLKAIKDQKQGVLTLNKLDKHSLDDAIENIIAITAASQQDPAYDIAGKQQPEEFSAGQLEPEKDTMFERLSSYLSTVKEQFPDTILESTIFDFNRSDVVIQNSEGVDFSIKKGVYGFSTMFTTRKDKKSSSFNYSSFLAKSLDNDLIDCGSIRTLLKQSAEQLELKQVPCKFEGDIIITPDCLEDFIFSLTQLLSDYYLISGISIFKDSLQKQIAPPLFTLHSKPFSKELAYHYFVTSDGFKAEDSTIVDKGVLTTFLLTLYGARKTGLKRAVNNGSCYIVEPGNSTLDQMIRSIKKGLLLCRISGGHPNDNGDFSAVAKNSYYIEDGEIAYPVNETMISGNIAELFRSIRSISSERINFGNNIFPWVQVGGLTIFGKQ
jgi:PmbA protein